jgi:4-amino-4-deoxy-L-arabinose transferase-like glycosyltransferase
MNVAYLARNKEALMYLALLLLTAAVLFLTGAPTGGAFSWSDSPRHALNGAFVLDLLRDAPLNDPTGYAYNYYSQYPALTILFYPPFFYFVLAVFYALFGVSQEVATFAVFIFYFALAGGTYSLARLWLSPALSFGVALILISAPEVAFWGRQVMLEIPAFALLTWSAYFLIRYSRDNRPVFFYLSLVLLLLALYTKISVAFISLAYLGYLAHTQRTNLFRIKHHYYGLALFLICCIPLAYISLYFGRANMQSVTGIPDAEVSRANIQGWLWYARALPDQIGWPALGGAIAFVLTWFWNRIRGRSVFDDTFFFLLWFIAGYLFYSAIDLKEARHSIFILLPVAIASGFMLRFAFSKRPHWAGIGVAALGLVSLSITMTSRPVHYVHGYKEVAEYVSTLAPKNSNVLFSGYRDGAFIFNMRAYVNRSDLSVVRADKLLLKIAVRRSLGVEQQKYSEEEIADLISNSGVYYVVAQSEFWTDLDQMAKLKRVLESPRFEEIRRFELQSNFSAPDTELVVYRNLGEVASGPIRITNDLPIIGREIQGTIGGKKD